MKPEIQSRSPDLPQKSMKTLPPVHPGEILLEDFMKPIGLSQYRVAKDIGVSSLRISQIVRGKRGYGPAVSPLFWDKSGRLVASSGPV
jgi:hypothetical protein